MKFIVEDMSCNHCVGAITKAVKAKDANAEVKTDLSTKHVEVKSLLNAVQIAAIIEDAGYSVKAVD